MAQVTLTAEERNTIKIDPTVKGSFIDQIVATFGFYAGTNNGDVAWARARNWSARVKRNPTLLTQDMSLMDLYEIIILGREFDKRDDQAAGDVVAQHLAYISTVWGFVIDDYYANKNADLIM